MKRVHEGGCGERLEHGAAAPASRRRELRDPRTAFPPILAALRERPSHVLLPLLRRE